MRWQIPFPTEVPEEGDIRWRGAHEACARGGEAGASSEMYFRVGSGWRSMGMSGDSARKN